MRLITLSFFMLTLWGMVHADDDRDDDDRDDGSRCQSVTTGGVNVVVGDRLQPDRITLIRAGNFTHSTRSALTNIFEVAIKSIDVCMYSTSGGCDDKSSKSGGAAASLTMRPSLLVRPSGSSDAATVYSGNDIHIQTQRSNVASGPFVYRVGGVLGRPAYDIDFSFWFRGQAKQIPTDGNYLRVNLDGIRFGPPKISGKLNITGRFSPETMIRGTASFGYQ